VSTTEADNKARFRRAYEEMLSRGDLSTVDELIAPDFLNHEAPPGMNRGPESMRGLVNMLRTAFPDLHFTIEELIAEGDIVAGRLTMRGPHRGPFMGIPPPADPWSRRTCISSASGTARPWSIGD
jgi:predicted ester cyclase